VTVAGVLQLTYLSWGAHRTGFPMRMRWPRMTKGVRRLIAQGIPGVVAGGVTQINIVLGTLIASLEPGAVSQLYYADRLYELPLAMVGIALGVLLLPEVSRHLAAGNAQAAMESQNRSAQLAMLLTVPAAVALMVIPGPIVSVFFERGAFTKADTMATSMALAIFAAGLPSFVLIMVFSPAYFAERHKDADALCRSQPQRKHDGLPCILLSLPCARHLAAARHSPGGDARRLDQRFPPVAHARHAKSIRGRSAFKARPADYCVGQRGYGPDALPDRAIFGRRAAGRPKPPEACYWLDNPRHQWLRKLFFGRYRHGTSADVCRPLNVTGAMHGQRLHRTRIGPVAYDGLLRAMPTGCIQIGDEPYKSPSAPLRRSTSRDVTPITTSWRVGDELARSCCTVTW
jgi:hypothetical protein